MTNKTTEQEILAKVENTQKMVNEIHIVVAGQPKYGQKGLKDTINDHVILFDKMGKRIDGLEERFDKRDKTEFKRNLTIGVVSGSGGIGAASVFYLTKTWLLKVAATLAALIKI